MDTRVCLRWEEKQEEKQKEVIYNLCPPGISIFRFYSLHSSSNENARSSYELKNVRPFLKIKGTRWSVLRAEWTLALALGGRREEQEQGGGYIQVMSARHFDILDFIPFTKMTVSGRR